MIDLRRDLYCEVGLILPRKHDICYLVENLRQLPCVVLAYREDDGFADLSANGISVGVFKECLAKELVRAIGEKLLLKLALLIVSALVSAVFILEINNESLLRQKLRRDAGSGIDNRRVDEVAILDTIEQRVTESGLVILAATYSVGVEKKPTLVLARVFGGGILVIEPFEVVTGRRG